MSKILTLKTILTKNIFKKKIKPMAACVDYNKFQTLTSSIQN